MTTVIDPQLELLSTLAPTTVPTTKTADDVSPAPNSQKDSPPSPTTPTVVSQPLVRYVRTIVVDGVTFQVLPPEDCPDAVTIGEAPKRSNAKTLRGVLGVKRAAEENGGPKWDKKRRMIIDAKLCPDPKEGPESDEDDDFYFTGEPLPAWMNAEREFQPDGRPGVYLLRPSVDDFENRFREMLEIMQPIGQRLGAVKIKVPEKCLVPAVPYPDYLAEFVSKNGCDPPEPQVYTMDQHLPLHPHSNSSLAPIYKVISRDQHHVPISEFPHPLELKSHRSHIPEKNLLFRGRTWAQILDGNPGGEVQYSSDNDASPNLRSYLGLRDPKLCDLAGNVLFQSENQVVGIHTPYLYLGNAYTLFALHMEDYSALSLNYHHEGAMKSWRIICPFDYWKAEQLVQDTQRVKPNCSQFVRHASVFLSEAVLKTAGIRSLVIQQRKGELVCTWPMAYHQGWNEGPNICEAIGYGGSRWKDVFITKDFEEVYKACGELCEKAGHGVAVRLQFAEDEEANLTTNGVPPTIIKVNGATARPTGGAPVAVMM